MVETKSGDGWTRDEGLQGEMLPLLWPRAPNGRWLSGQRVPTWTLYPHLSGIRRETPTSQQPRLKREHSFCEGGGAPTAQQNKVLPFSVYLCDFFFQQLSFTTFFFFLLFCFFFLYWKIIALQYGAGFCDFLNRHGGAPGTRKIRHSLIMYHLVLSIAILLMFSAAFGGPQKAGF